MIVQDYLVELEQKVKQDKFYQEKVRLETERDIIQSELTYIQNKSAIYPSTDFSGRIQHLKDELAQTNEAINTFLNSDIEDFGKVKEIEQVVEQDDAKQDESVKDEQKSDAVIKDEKPENNADTKTLTFIVKGDIKGANKAKVKNIAEYLEKGSYTVTKSEYNKKLKAMILELSYTEGTDVIELPDYCTVLESYEWQN